LTVFRSSGKFIPFLSAQRVLGNGMLGEISRFEARLRASVRCPFRAAARAAEAGGLLYDLSSHLIDQALQLFGWMLWMLSLP
jgi:predicted dehydrogenase